ncbi:putative uncharacterized protein MYH16 [Acropora muricata]|uniref:putative uncharacterized protein MYH16 n=1 Tax=Acropora muricata TaxID=159855 RepID=UPI0034E4D0DA
MNCGLEFFWRSILNGKNMSSEFDDITRISQDIAIQSNVKSLECVDVLNTNYELQLQKNKNHLANLKTVLLRLQGQSRFLDNLAKENLSSTGGMDMTEHQQNLRKESKEDKNEIEQLESDISSLAETLCSKHNVLKEKLELLDKKLCSTKEKKTKLEILQPKLEEVESKIELQKNTEMLKELKAKQQEAATAIEECKTSITSLEHCKTLLQVEVTQLQDGATKLIEEFKIQQAIKQENQQREGTRTQWFATAVELYSSLGGVRVQSMQGDSVVLEIPSDTQPVGLEESSPSLILTIKFRLQGGAQAVFAGAEINLDLPTVEDLVNHAIRTNDVVAFILQVKELFRKQRNLMMEVKQLQANYAMDWEPNHGRVRVMLGRSGKVVCTLKVDSKYSIGQGQVQLLGVEGGSNREGIQQLQNDGANRNLTEWIEKLQELFSDQ